jgi:hypothetical protein
MRGTVQISYHPIYKNLDIHAKIPIQKGKKEEKGRKIEDTTCLDLESISTSYSCQFYMGTQVRYHLGAQTSFLVLAYFKHPCGTQVNVFNPLE